MAPVYESYLSSKEELWGSDIKMPSMPFHENPKELMRPVVLESGNTSSVVRQMTFDLPLSPEDFKKIQMDGEHAEVFIRFCPVVYYWPDDLCKDLFPLSLYLYVNGKQIPLKKKRLLVADRKKCSMPLNITKYLKMEGRNELCVKWGYKLQDDEKNPCLNYGDDILLRAFLYQRLSIYEIAGRIVEFNPFISKKTGITTINQMLTDGDEENLASCMNVSLVCPLSKKRIELPCRGINCKHPVCFDLLNFLETCKNSFKFRCAICNVVMELQDLCIDFYFLKLLTLLKDVPKKVHAINLLKDGKFNIVTQE